MFRECLHHFRFSLLLLSVRSGRMEVDICVVLDCGIASTPHFRLRTPKRVLSRFKRTSR